MAKNNFNYNDFLSDEIKQNIEKAAEKQQRLANLIGFYTGEFAQ